MQKRLITLFLIVAFLSATFLACSDPLTGPVKNKVPAKTTSSSKSSSSKMVTTSSKVVSSSSKTVSSSSKVVVRPSGSPTVEPEVLVDPVAFDANVVSTIIASGKTPMLIASNNDRFPADQIYIGIIGNKNGQGVWMDPTNGATSIRNSSVNTLAKPNSSKKYANIFRKLSEVPNNTIPFDRGISAGKMFIAFKSPLFINFFDDGGYAAPSLAAGSADPSSGIRFEVVELSYRNDGVIWINTSRVDAYQYPMGLEVWGDHRGITATYGTDEDMIYKRIGEMITHDQLLAKWKSDTSAPFQACLIARDGDYIIEQPSKISNFSSTYFDTYINDIWNTYKTKELKLDIGDRGVWTGKVVGESFVFTGKGNQGEQATGKIPGKPTSKDVIEGAGMLATGAPGGYDLMIQAQVCAAINRGAIWTDVPADEVQDNHDADRFFVKGTYNEYVSFFHSPISYLSQTYAFAYDDVGDHSSTVVFEKPYKIRITIGGFYGLNVPK